MFTAFTVLPVRVEFETNVLRVSVLPTRVEKPMFTAFTVLPVNVDWTTAVAVTNVEPCTVEKPIVETTRVDVVMLLPVSVEKSPLFTLALVAFRRTVSSVHPWAVENPRVDTVREDVISVEPCAAMYDKEDTERVDVTMLLPVSVEKSPLFTFAAVAFRSNVVSVLPWLVEKPMVDATSVDVLMDEPYSEE
jgi:hypothetical protein